MAALGISSAAAETLASFGSMADVAQCASAEELVACSGMSEDSAHRLVQLWHSSASSG